MKSVINTISGKFGFKINRFPKSPYEYLKKVPRYQETVVDLLGRKFKIADSLSFYWSFREIFLQEIYKFESKKKMPVIIDCGSNYVTSIVYFKSLYPGSKIIGIEADPKVFRLLKWNIGCRNYQNVELFNKAVCVDTTPIRFYCEGADGSRAFPLERSKETVEVDPIHLDELICEPVDFLKMDIEGSETEVICSSGKLKRVSELFVEYHSFKDSEQTLGAILEKARLM
jgi:FkbM family methyltransferase